MRVYLDVDGVLADFQRAAHVIHGQPWAFEEPLREEVAGIWSLGEIWGISEDEFWEPINAAGAEFWRTLDFMPDADTVIEIVERVVGRENVIPVTACIHHPSAAAGRVAWLQEQMPEYRGEFFLGAAKHKIVAPDVVLLDDADHNVERFAKAGGRVILYPRPWNSAYADRHRALNVLEDGLVMAKKFLQLRESKR